VEGCRGIKLKNHPFSTFPYEYLDAKEAIYQKKVGKSGTKAGRSG
jgi:hypothetical protein